ncbi:hypothetical protein [Azospirillum sp.]|nr:hypothetical protein [Azospirillum sp.]HYD71102.1 hypothetical protein [Azospirillum sp.]HYH18061.1 hypothetical protein [Azospirillum sp.]
MAHELKSFRRDWQRWSPVERLAAIVLLVTATVILGGPVTLGLL